MSRITVPSLHHEAQVVVVTAWRTVLPVVFIKMPPLFVFHIRAASSKSSRDQPNSTLPNQVVINHDGASLVGHSA